MLVGMSATMHVTLNPTSTQVAIPVVARMASPVGATQMASCHLPFNCLKPQYQSLTRLRAGSIHMREQRTSSLQITCSSIPPPRHVDTQNGSSYSQSLSENQERVSSAEPYAGGSEDGGMDEAAQLTQHNLSNNPGRSDSIKDDAGQWCGWEASGGGSFHGWGPAEEPSEEASAVRGSSGRRRPVMVAGKCSLLISATQCCRGVRSATRILLATMVMAVGSRVKASLAVVHTSVDQSMQSGWCRCLPSRPHMVPLSVQGRL